MLDCSAKTVLVDEGSVDDVRLGTLKKLSRSVGTSGEEEVK